MRAPSQGIKDRLSLYGATWKGATARFWSGSEVGQRLPELLQVSYQVIRASVPLLESALEEAESRAPQDRVCALLAPYLRRHMEEERGHDQWLAQDLEALGITLDALDQVVPSPHVAGMVGAQYYWVRHCHPVAILGYLAVLEGEPPLESFFHEARVRSGLPEAAFRTLIYHARVDREHWKDLLDLVDTLPLEPFHTTLLGLSVLHTCEGMARAQEVLEQAKVSGPVRDSA